MLEKFNYKIPFNKAYGSVLINAKEWHDNDTQLIQAYNMKGERCISYINTVLKTNYNEDIYGTELQEGDVIFITKQASRISYLAPYKIKGEDGEFANVHLLNIVGKFKNGIISYENLQPLFNKVLMSTMFINSSLLCNNEKTVIGKVLKTGTNSFDKHWNPVELEVKVGQTVLVQDNISTELTLDGTDYIAMDDSMCVGYFNSDDYTIDNLVMYGKNILLEDYTEDKIEGSSLLFSPPVNGDISDISEIYKDNRFKVVNASSNISSIKVGDKVVADRDYVHYVTLNNKTYCLLHDTRYILGTFE